MKEKRKNELDNLEPNAIDDLANFLIACGIVIGVFLVVIAFLFLLMLATSQFTKYMEIEELTQIVQQQCEIVDYHRYDYTYRIEQDYLYVYSDYLPEEKLEIRCEKGFQSDWHWQCTCTKQD